MEFADGSVRLSAGADDVGRAEEDDYAGEPLTIAFNPTYLTDGLSSLRSGECLSGLSLPCYVRCPGTSPVAVQIAAVRSRRCRRTMSIC